MNKAKIAISIDQGTLQEIDKVIDGQHILSRSQAIEVLLKDAIKKRPVAFAVMLIKKGDIGHLFNKVRDNVSLIDLHVDFLLRNGITELFLITEEDELLKERVKAIQGVNVTLISEKKQAGTALALSNIQDRTKHSFVVLNGDTFNNFELKKMLDFHSASNAVATIGLISSKNPNTFGSAVLDGNMIVDFKEKEETGSNIINAGVYVFNKDVFNFFDKDVKSLERDLFPKLAKLNQLQGFFTKGEYYHAGGN